MCRSLVARPNKTHDFGHVVLEAALERDSTECGRPCFTERISNNHCGDRTVGSSPRGCNCFAPVVLVICPEPCNSPVGTATQDKPRFRSQIDSWLRNAFGVPQEVGDRLAGGFGT